MRIVLVLISLSTWIGVSAETIIHAGYLFDSRNGSVLEEQTIVIEGDEIIGVANGYRAADKVIDLKDSFVSPGWHDMHVHVINETSAARYLERFTMNEGDLALRGTMFVDRILMAGITSVRDLGTRYGLAQAMRNAIAKGWIKGPRIYTSGQTIATTGGNGDRSNGQRRELQGNPGPMEGVVNGVDDIYEAVRARYKEGADAIKITSTGGVMSVARSGDNPQFTVEEISAVVAAARDYGFKVAAHAHGVEGMRRAVIGGVDSIEHGTYMTPKIMRLMKKKGTWLVPTVSAGEYVAEKAKIDGFLPEIVRPKAATVGVQIARTFSAAYEAGVPIAFGTDSGVGNNGDNWKEFLYMIDAGMPVLEALTTATKNSAMLIWHWDEVGSIEPGKKADIVALPDPREDVQAFGQVHFVMRDGTIFKHENTTGR